MTDVDVSGLGPWPEWDEIDHVLLDMDGTLLNLGFDNEFFSEFLPAQYALANDISEDAAQEDDCGVACDMTAMPAGW